MWKFVSVLMLMGALLAAGLIWAEPAEESKESKETEEARAYVGVAKCKMCHSSDKKGAQYKVWEASPHAGAFAVLGTPEAQAVAMEAGVEGNPQESAQCLECHTTGATAPAELTAKVKPENGVTCEACHGPGADYFGMKVMKAIFAGETDMASVGLTLPTEEVCLRCHNERSPTYKEFDFEKRVAKIAHPYPEEFAATRGQAAAE